MASAASTDELSHVEDVHDGLRAGNGTASDLEGDSESDSESEHHAGGLDAGNDDADITLDAHSDTASEDSADSQLGFFQPLFGDDDKARSYGLSYNEIFGGGDEMAGDQSFPQFRRLPLEIQYRVWELFSPELALASRVYRLTLSISAWDWSSLAVSDDYNLSEATQGVRRVLAVHRESRELAMRILPDVLPLDFVWKVGTKGIVRFNRKRDVVQLRGRIFEGEDFQRKRMPSAYLERVENLGLEVGFGSGVVPEAVPRYEGRLREFHNLKRVYFCQYSGTHAARNYRWVTSPGCHRQVMRVGVEGWPMIYCWPCSGLETPDKLTRRARGLRPEAARAGWELLPMVVFAQKFGWEHYGWIQDRAKLSDDEFEAAAAGGTVRRRYSFMYLAPESDAGTDEMDEDLETV